MASNEHPAVHSIRKYQLLLATLVATVACPAGFNPPGGVQQDMNDYNAHSHIIYSASLRRIFFVYCNATAFGTSFVIIILFFIELTLSERKKQDGVGISRLLLLCLSWVMVLEFLMLIGAYASGAFLDTVTAIYTVCLAVCVVFYLIVQVVLVQAMLRVPKINDRNNLEPACKVLMLLATFVVSVTYLAGLSAPGLLWDTAVGHHHPGDMRSKVFFITNTTAFIGSLFLILAVILHKNSNKAGMILSRRLYICSITVLISIVIAYAAGSCRERDTTIYVCALVGAVVTCILVQLAIVWYFKEDNKEGWLGAVSTWLQRNSSDAQQETQAFQKAVSRVLMVASFAATSTYQAGLNPPGGFWQEDSDGHMAGDPILLSTNAILYKVFYYCNSIAFVMSMVTVTVRQLKSLHRHNALEAVVTLNMLSIMGAYAAGSSRDMKTFICTMSVAMAVLVYLVIHVVFFSRHRHHGGTNRMGNDRSVDKKGKSLLQLLILAATITYQAGLTPPGGFQTSGGHRGRAGDPKLLHDLPRHYKAFFYCNSASFVLSTALTIILVNKNLYRPAVQSKALSFSMVVGTLGLLGAFVVGSTQRMKMSFYIIGLVATILMFVLVLGVSKYLQGKQKRRDDGAQGNTSSEGLAVLDLEGVREPSLEQLEPSSSGTPETEADSQKKMYHSKRKYLMLLGILVASATYQAGLQPPGGLWEGDGQGHATGDPIMLDHSRPRYLAFFCSNSISFVASIVVIVLLLPERLQQKKWWQVVMRTTIWLDLLGLQISYASGSSRSWKTSGYVCVLLIAVLVYFAIHVMLSRFISKTGERTIGASSSQENEGNGGGHLPATTALA